MLDPSADEIHAWGNSVVQLMTEYFDGLREAKLFPNVSARKIRDGLEAALPQDGVGFDDLLEVFRRTIIPFSRHNAHPRMFGYVQSPGTPVAAFADFLASVLNAN